MTEYDPTHPGTGYREPKRRKRISAFTNKPTNLTEEQEIQIICVKHYDELARMDRYLREQTRLFAIAPNDGLLPLPQAVKAKRMGKRAGPYDLIFYDYRRRFREVWIEMKAPKGRLTEEQEQYRDFHARRGVVETWEVRTKNEFIAILESK